MKVIPEEDVYLVNISGVQSDWMSRFSRHILEGEEIIGHLWWSGHLTCAL